jgi:asparagine synthase (glutamine-hydrolysing)
MLGGSGDAERLLRLVEITDAPVRRALLGPNRVRDAGVGPSLSGDAESERLSLALDVLADVPGRDLLDQALHLDTRMFLPDGILICNDKMSMAASLELRVPFLDVELMRFVERVPARMRVRPRAGKRIHRMAMERILPPGIADRPKHGFATPYDEWLRASLGEEVERRYGSSTPLAELIRPEAVAKLVAEHRRGRADHKAILYCLLELSEWHRTFVEAREPSLAEA